jgi:hypothetical protein
MTTYGSRDRNPFQGPETYLLNGVSTPSNLGSTRYYTLVEADGPNKGQITIKSPTIAGNIGGANADRTIGVIPLDNQFKPTPGSTTSDELKYFSSAAGQLSVKNHGVITAQKAGAQNAQQLIFPNSAAPGAGQGQNQPPTTPGADPITGDSSSGINAENLNTLQTAVDTKLVEGTRTSYDQNVKYPEQLSLENQDCIKFSILEYKPRTLSLALDQQRRKPNFNNAIGSIILPIPAGIGDRNGVSWNDDRIGQLASGFGGAALSYIAGGTDAATSSAQESIDAISGGPGGEKLLEAIIAAKATEAALGDINVMARQFGAVFNQNLELLFNSPTLRDFTFNFRFTPRSPSEAKIVRKIIRYFKQAMAPKRSTSVLLLKTPHTFGIQYLSSNEDHPYLNKFKECALTNCAVNYTPDGTYMTYSGKLDERSMTAYELNLTFQELEPIFDDDYGNEAEINSIGY